MVNIKKMMVPVNSVPMFSQGDELEENEGFLSLGSQINQNLRKHGHAV
eukprot:CAMPEP_0184699234 /NCGR_PEP_ID=MMETSP0313-20130426/5577_1 /TAXON_ID=2792 /ORGANISM="Porphyridium aerugineum, Strain SAG 1380-2" /LENGTH=47 /DNA_ID= /DNA_START= /DNA_END= /DNA_ORIENTATION=